MSVKRRILVIFCLVLLIGSAMAIDLTPSTISTSNPGWLIANDGTDQSTITVVAMQTGTPATPVTSANVAFSLDPASAMLGTITPASVLTGADGKATAVFKTSRISGTATIIATISFADGMTAPVQRSIIQRIDHDTPQGATFENPAELPVGSETQVKVTLVDRWGNRIDNKNAAETIRLTMADEGGAGLKDGLNYITQKTYTTDAEGNVTADLRISTTIRSNYIQMDPIGNIVVPPGTWILGVAESEPYYISQTAASPKSVFPADGDPVNAAEIYYTVTDKYDNPITGASVYCDSTDGMSVTAPTNTWGLLRISFGPKDTVGLYTIKAVPLGNTSAVCKGTGTVGYCSQVIEYYNTDPVDLTFTGNPQSMTSLDVNSATRSVLQARVIDIKGNPVIGQVVSFSLAPPTYPGGPYIETAAPVLSVASAPVGVGGYATTQFTPGAFAASGLGYNSTATGQVIATATWTNAAGTITKSRDVTLVWKNYPYISTSSLGDCGNSQVGDMVNITIKLSGDGAALRPKPVDAVLVMDMSGSMGPSFSTMTGPIGVQYKYVYAAYAGKTFVDKMDSSKDKIGLVIYNGSVYPTDSLSTSFTTVKTHLDSMHPAGYTNQRGGTKNALDDIVANKDSSRVQAVIVMTDGQYNLWGDPLARGAGTLGSGGTDSGTNYYPIPGLAANWQNLSQYAKDNNIRIYTVTFGTDAAIQSGTALYTTMDRIAETTGGAHYHATDGAQLTDVYTKIAGALQETAGGNTQVALDFGTVNINDDPALDIRDYMDYVYKSSSPAQSSDSTYINKTNITKSGVYNQLISVTRDDTASWAARSMAFNVGTINLNETWSATFSLNLTKAGKIDLFGPSSSSISFVDAATGNTQTGFIPAMQCRVRESIVNTGFGSKLLRVDNLTVQDGASTDTWTVQWNTTYDGARTVQEAILFRVAGDPQWTTVPGGLVYTYTPVFEEQKQHTISVADTALWPPGKCFDIEIVAGAEDANAARTGAVQKCKAPSNDTIYIKLD